LQHSFRTHLSGSSRKPDWRQFDPCPPCDSADARQDGQTNIGHLSKEYSNCFEDLPAFPRNALDWNGLFPKGECADESSMAIAETSGGGRDAGPLSGLRAKARIDDLRGRLLTFPPECTND
jgi:hypothetical protein